MNRKSFWIPVGWGEEPRSGLADLKTSLNSNTLVLVTSRTISAPFEVERIRGSWSKHIPEKRPKYRVSWGEGQLWGGSTVDLEPVRLQSVAVGNEILVPLLSQRPQVCLNFEGRHHGIYFARGPSNPYTYCGEDPYLGRSEQDVITFVRGNVTCPACLTYESVWCHFTVFPYERPEPSEKLARKVKSAEERRQRLPTAYARILDDDLFENPTYKPVKQRVVPTVDIDETEDYIDHRDRKRGSAIDRIRRIEESKARVQGHRR